MAVCFRWSGALIGVLACALFTAGARAADVRAPSPVPAPNAAPSDAPASSDRVAQRARELFDEGVRLANEGRFDSARAVFRSAYELQPHPSVLYNIAQCEVRLGDNASAVATLERFLETGAGDIQEEQRRAVQKQLDELRATLPAEEHASEPAPLGGEPAPEPPGHTPAAAELVRTAPSPADSAIQPPRTETSIAPPSPPAAETAGKPASLRPLVLAGTGVALLGAATAVYLWNDARHDAWTTEHDALASTPGFREQLTQDLALWQRANASNQRLSSIHSVDAVTVLLASAGALAVGAGVWDWLASGGSDGEAASVPLRLQAGSSPMLRWQGRW